MYHVYSAKPKTAEQTRQYKLNVARKRLSFWLNVIKELEQKNEKETNGN